MDKQRHQAERRSLNDMQRREDAVANPQHFYPRPDDVVDDDTLSQEEKRTLLRNWQVQVEGRGGALGEPHGPGEGSDAESDSLHASIAAALQRLDGVSADGS